mmetsp:Transcript_10861/g.23957  ORF Transcript_10861/g.23957 Transcript_10861/m.23957 type:complete len:224 (+) Transcript_10861:65-736(+)
MRFRTPPLFCETSKTGPCSTTRPLSSTQTWSKSMIVSSRWATATTVESLKASWIVFCTSSCVFGSMALVASSNKRSRGSRRTMRAMQINCLCPKLREPPSSLMTFSIPSGQLAMTSESWTRSSAFRSLSSEKNPRGSKFDRSVPVKRTGSWGTKPIALLKVPSPIFVVSTPSNKIRPVLGSKTLNKAQSRLDFPQPVVPQIPTFVLGSKVTVTPFKTSRMVSP